MHFLSLLNLSDGDECCLIRLLSVILEHFDQVVGDCFMDCVNCLIGFANNKTSHRISLKAIALLRICEDRLAEVWFPVINEVTYMYFVIFLLCMII